MPGVEHGTPLVLPTGRIEFSPLEALRLEAGYAGLPGRDEGGLATARLQVLSGDTWAVAPWAGVFSIAESPLLPIAGLAFSAGSERLRFDMSIPIYMPIYPAPPVGPGLLATEITLGWTPVEQHTVRLGTTTVAVYRAGYQFQPDSGLMARADAGMGWDGSVVGSMSVGFTW